MSFVNGPLMNKPLPNLVLSHGCVLTERLNSLSVYPQRTATAYIYRVRLIGFGQVWRILFLLLHTASALACLQNSHNQAEAF